MTRIRRIRFAILAFIRSHDGSTPERPRRDGTYGWPQVDARHPAGCESCARLAGRSGGWPHV